ncbi:secreted protein [gut metagenome]|uniref:Secreted protein n=1 Tax=gut metagenome TaxID=749906 RepID=J9GN70_9ZZZZ
MSLPKMKDYFLASASVMGSFTTLAAILAKNTPVCAVFCIIRG